MHTITVSHSQHAHSPRITVLNNSVKQVGREGISPFITPAQRSWLGGAGLAARDGEALSLWRSARTLIICTQRNCAVLTQNCSCRHGNKWRFWGSCDGGKRLFILRVEIYANRLQENLGSPGDEVSLLLRNAKRNPPSAVCAQPVLLITKVRLWLELKWLFIIPAEPQNWRALVRMGWHNCPQSLSLSWLQFPL